MDLYEIAFRIIIAATLGAIIGIEREYRDKSAGFRTMILISVGSALFTLLSINLAAETFTNDPSRIISYIVSGIGFLGAGVIIKDGTSIKGITTASTIWLAAGVGMGAGMGYYEVSVVAAGAGLFALIVLPPIERWIDLRHEHRHYEIEVKTARDCVKVLQIFKQLQIEVFHVRRSKLQHGYKLIVDADGAPLAYHHLEDKLIEHPDVISY